MKYRDVVKLLIWDGWYMKRESGSHKQYVHPTKTGKVTIAPHGMNADVPPGTLNAILKQAGLK